MKRWRQLLICVLVLVSGAAALEERKVVDRVQPDYPELAKRMNIRGSVKLKAWVSADGTVSRTEYVTGHPVLADQALRAVKKWKFEPASKESVVNVEVVFGS